MGHKLEIKDISRSFFNEDGKKTVLSNISFYVDEGEFICILGPSGCGKSTLLRHITGFETPDSGSILLNGVELSGTDPGRIMVFQDFNQLFPWKTVLENVMFPMKAIKAGHNKKDIKEKAQRLLSLVKLDGFDDYYPHQLSGGMKQKTAIARALALDPEILLMDEPFGSLDAQSKASLQEMLLKIWKDTGKTILFVTHDIYEALILSDRIVIMDGDKGSIKSIIDNTMERPRTPSSPGFPELWGRVREQV